LRHLTYSSPPSSSVAVDTRKGFKQAAFESLDGAWFCSRTLRLHREAQEAVVYSPAQWAYGPGVRKPNEFSGPSADDVNYFLSLDHQTLVPVTSEMLQHYPAHFSKNDLDYQRLKGGPRRSMINAHTKTPPKIFGALHKSFPRNRDFR
jgi:hypothetical protein